MKESNIVIAAGYTGSLGMVALNLEDQNGKKSVFHFLSSGFKPFAETTARVAEQVVPADMLIAAPIPRISTEQMNISAVATKWSESQSAAFSIMVNPVENVAFLCLRSASGDEAITPLDAETIDKLIKHLHEARNAIAPAQPGRH